jgi:hypothetical protein
MTTQPDAARPDEGAYIPAGYTLVGHGGGGGYTVIGPNGEVADGIGDVFLAVRTAQAHAAGEPVPAAEPAHTLSLPARCTVGELRALLRQVPASARLADVRILGAEVVARLTDLADVELRFTGGAR